MSVVSFPLIPIAAIILAAVIGVIAFAYHKSHE